MKNPKRGYLMQPARTGRPQHTGAIGRPIFEALEADLARADERYDDLLARMRRALHTPTDDAAAPPGSTP